MQVEEIIKKIKEKKNLKGLPDELVKEELEKIIKKYNFESLSEKDSKFIIKEVRAVLRRISGSFNIKEEKHVSVEERKEFYKELNNLIKSLKVKSILDLGCGLNPLNIARPGIYYYASDINLENLKLIEEHFRNNSIKGKVFFYDLRKFDASLPKADLCLLLKVVDLIEKRGHKLSEKIIKGLDCRYIIVSFPTKTLSGKPMNHPQRGWIERMLNRLNYNFKTIISYNEIFYLIEKST